MRNTHFNGFLSNAQYALRNTHIMPKMRDMKAGEKIKQIRLGRGLTLAEVEHAAGIAEGNLSRIERGKQWASEEKLDGLAKALGVKISEFFTDDQFNAEDEQQIPPGRYIAIVGVAQGGPDGFISIDDHPPGHGDGSILTYSSDQNAYAIRVRGDSMRPRIKNGEYIVAEPSMEARPGNDVVVKLKDGRGLVKELLWQTPEEIRLGSINSDVEAITIPIEDVESIHRVAAIVPVGSALLRDLYSKPSAKAVTNKPHPLRRKTDSVPPNPMPGE